MRTSRTIEDYHNIALYINSLLEGNQISSALELGQHLVSAGYLNSLKKPTIYAFLNTLRKRGVIETNWIKETKEYTVKVNPKWLKNDIREISLGIQEEKTLESIKKENISSLEDLINKIEEISLDKNVISLLKIHGSKFLKYKEDYENILKQMKELDSILDSKIDNINLQINDNKIELKSISLRNLFDILIIKK